MTDPRDDADGTGPPSDDDPTSTADDGSGETDWASSNDSTGEPTNAPGEKRDGGQSVTAAPPRDAGVGDPADTPGERTVVSESVETPGEPRTLDPRVRYSWVVGPLIGAVAAALVAGAATWFAGHRFLPADRTSAALGVVGVVFLLFAAYGVFKAVYLYRSWRYVVRTESLYLTRGVFTKVQTVVPYVRVQHIDTRRSAFERVLGLSTLVVYTAGSRGADVTVPGLLPDTAEDLQSRLERLAIESEDEDAV